MLQDRKLTVLMLGGYGFFGDRLSRLLMRHADLHLVIAGRHLPSAQAHVQQLLAQSALASLSAVAMDRMSGDLAAQIKASSADVLVNFCGPFQAQHYTVAEAAIAAGVPYIDLADGRDFVSGITALDAAARAADVFVISGASSVPALSTAAIDHLAVDLTDLSVIDVSISPGNRTDLGLATLKAIFSYCGQPLRIWHDGAWTQCRAWIGHRRHHYPAPVGARWLTYCDVPDLDLHPVRYPTVRSVRFNAGLELPVLHFALSAASWLRSKHLLPDLQRFSTFAKWASERFMRFGSDAGGMHVDVTGKDHNGQTLTKRWTLIAQQGHGPFVPTLAAAALIRKMAAGQLTVRGAMPCMGLLSLDDFVAEAAHLAITTEEASFR